MFKVDLGLCNSNKKLWNAKDFVTQTIKFGNTKLCHANLKLCKLNLRLLKQI